MSISVDVSQDNKKLIYSNRICCISEKSLYLDLKLEDNNLLKLVFSFFDKSNEEPYVNIKSDSPNIINLDFYNFNSSFGTGIKEPLRFAKYKGKDIFIVFYVYKIQECNTILDLSIYMEN